MSSAGVVHPRGYWLLKAHSWTDPLEDAIPSFASLPWAQDSSVVRAGKLNSILYLENLTKFVSPVRDTSYSDEANGPSQLTTDAA